MKRNNDWSSDEWNDEGNVGWHEDYERMCCTTATPDLHVTRSK